MKAFSILLVILMTYGVTYGQDTNTSFTWPEGKKAAVCLTFDDGHDAHLDIAVPMLDSFGVRGTFYCPGYATSLHNRISEWGSIVEKGHELGNHSLFHPCDGETFDWVKPEYDISTYSMAQMQMELFTANTLLSAVDGKKERTYGYTCSNYQVRGDSSFVDVVGELFSAGRTDGPIPNTMDSVDVNFMPSWCVDSHSGAELIEYVEEARDNGTIATFMFHSVGGGYLNVSTEALEELLVYLQENEKDYWVDTFYNVSKYVKEEKEEE